MSPAQNVNKIKKEEPQTRIVFDRRDNDKVRSFTLTISRVAEVTAQKQVKLNVKITSQDQQVGEIILGLLSELKVLLHKEDRVAKIELQQTDLWMVIYLDVSDIKPHLVPPKAIAATTGILDTCKRYFVTGIIPYKLRDKGVKKTVKSSQA